MNADRNLLFGILALQLDFIDRDALLGAMNAWVREKDKPLGQLLQDQGVLSPDRRVLLDSLVREHLSLHDSDPAKSVAAASTVESVSELLQQIDDPDVRASLPDVSREAGRSESYATQPGDEALAAMGMSSASGLRFRVVRPHAEGGLGKVSVALDEELHREVALKEIKERHADSPQSRSRFVLEAEITGGLEHPGIVPVYSLGRYADGRPFYAMRFIRGENLQQAIQQFHQSPEQASMALRQLLRRFLDVCNAVAYAHSRGVLHRDLKPNNIMLGQYGETLVVDWGLAKSMHQAEAVSGSGESGGLPVSPSGATPTRQGQIVGTPQFMSPEQASGLLDQMGPASDVYSLGATLHCLLTGHPPFPDSRQVGQDEVLRRVRDGEFPSPRTVNSDVPPPLDAICMKAMRLQPAERYPSARALADDIEHWLADEPVQAWREPVLARLARWGRRHRAVAAGTAALLLTVTLASVVGVVLLNRKQQETELARLDAERQRIEAQRQERIARESQERAEAETRKKGAIVQFMTGMFEASDPLGLGGVPFYIPRATGEELKARDILQRGAGKISTELKDQPDIQAAVMATIGDVSRTLGQYEQAERLLRSAYELRKNTRGPDDLDVADSAHALGWLYHEKGDYERAYQLYQEARAIRLKHLPRDDSRVVDIQFNLAWLLTQMGGFAEAEQLFREVIAQREKSPPSRALSLANFGLAAMYLEKGEPLAALSPSVTGLSIFQQLEEGSDVGQAVALCQRGIMSLMGNKDLTQARDDLESCLKIARRILPPKHIYIAFVLYELAVVHEEQGNRAEAAALYRECLDVVDATTGLGHPKAAVLVGSYAIFLHDLGKTEEGERLCLKLLDAHRKKFGPNHPLVGDALLTHAQFRHACGDEAGREKLLREAVHVYERDMRWPSLRFLHTVVELANLCMARPEAREETLRLLRLALHLCDKLNLKDPASKPLIQLRLARTLQRGEAPSDLQEAETLLRDAYEKGKADKSLQVLKQVLPPVLEDQSALYRRLGRIAEAANKARELGNVWPADPQYAYAAGCHLSACVPLTGKDTAMKESCGKDAVACLVQAVEKGLKETEKLGQDPRLAPLKDRPEFQALVERLKSRR